MQACPSPRDRAIATVFFYAGLRLAELAALDVGGLSVSARRGRSRVRAGKGDAYPEVPLNSVCRKAIDESAKARSDQLAPRRCPGRDRRLVVVGVGDRMSARAIDSWSGGSPATPSWSFRPTP